MQTARAYYPSNGYSSSNVIEIADSFSSFQPAASSSSMLANRKGLRRLQAEEDKNRKSCTYLEASKPRGPPKAYITGLEDRLEKMEALLRRVSGRYAYSAFLLQSGRGACSPYGTPVCVLRPETDFSSELGPPVVRDSWKTEQEAARRLSPHEKSSSPSAPPQRLKDTPPASSPSRVPQPLGISTPIVPSSHISNYSRRSAGTPRTDTDASSDYCSSSDSDELGELSISRGMKRLTLRGLEPASEGAMLADSQNRFHGKSSSFKLIGPARKLREEHMNMVTNTTPYGTGFAQNSNSAQQAVPRPNERRSEFWSTPSWELASEGFKDGFEDLCASLTAEFPPLDLADNLIKLYFRHVNPQFPLFHRPTFEKQWRDGLAEKDPWFGCLCLSLFAVASRWSDDPRVLADGFYDMPEEEGANQNTKWQRAGWSYFNTAADVHRGSRSLFHPPNLFEVQTLSLMGMFLRGTAFHPVAWLFISIGLRKAQDVGAHRKKVYGNKPSVDEELWKRAFWMLVLYDRIGSAALGRPCCSGEEDFDVELPLEVDDEYWEPEDPAMAFHQPADKPSMIAAFNSHLKLTKIAAYALRTIYAIDRSKLMVSAARPRWQEVLTQLNTAMTEWVDSVPSHLRWSSQIEDQLFANQAATLYTTYYLIQILIYRPFLPSSLHSLQAKPPHSNMPVPCIAICVNAGKCCARILRTQIQRGLSNIPNLICTAHMCAAVLLMNFWDLKAQERAQLQSGLMEDVKPPLAHAMAELLEDVSVFTEALELVRPRWRNAEVYLRDLGTSMPHTPDDQYYPDEPQRQARSQYTYQPQPATSYTRTPECRPVVSSTYPYTSPSSTGASPRWFDFPHITTHTMPVYPPWLCTPNAGLNWNQQQVQQRCRQPQQLQPHSQPASYPTATIQSYDTAQIIPSISTGRKTSLSSLSSGASVDGVIGGGIQYETLPGSNPHLGRSNIIAHPRCGLGVSESGWDRSARYNWQNGWEHTHAEYGANTNSGGGGMPAGRGYGGAVVSQPVVATPLKGESEYPHGHMLSYAGHY
ncbi:hypothetical protein SERLADRAFT_437067 [Serpula lacrymans var. lacrymans S7.9]|uniref:Xylanolytic transcriptional activator regulatory domain-containing protein n=1 Tax=Serpula lacrymans var. lacrymans (strain S7.9) TaxID=578457 RepID=F8NV50_SERL9|nr:uncharacterized protein SERLADRAFT_437067 [Serpula lacrymans var. lacrymans S7.9]EGO25312.1 hypothetical protein SERLADRAFT_437067 [Serpula lacrymans var. lacrymans S7.9]